jgi:hypothetical protein
MEEYRLEWRTFDCFFSVAGEWRICNEELHKFYSSPNINRVSKLRMTWIGHVTCGREEKCGQNVIQEREREETMKMICA